MLVLLLKKHFSLLPRALVAAVLLLASCGAQEVADTADPAVTTTILDLSEEFEYATGFSQTDGAETLGAYAATQQNIRTFMVLEHGKIVAEYVRDDVDPLIPSQMWSTTKSWISLLVGCMAEDGLILLNETLGDIFDGEGLWETTAANSTDIVYRKAVTLDSMLSMTSGLLSPPMDSDETTFSFMDGGTLGGASLADSLMDPLVDTEKKGTFQYLATNNILSYVIQQRTNMTPREYLAEKILPYLGIDNEAIGWWQNEDGIEYAYHGMLLTPLQMAKFGQLYLQQGRSNATYQLINPAWIEASTSLQGGTIFYGYLVWVFFGALLEMPELDKIFCSQGLGGQDICVSSSTDRVFVQQRDVSEETEGTDSDGLETLEIIVMALDPELRFATGEDTSAQESGQALNGSQSVVNILSAFVMLAALLACI